MLSTLSLSCEKMISVLAFFLFPVDSTDAAVRSTGV